MRLDHVCTQHFAFHLESLQDPPHPFAAVGVAPKELPWVLWVQGLVHGVAMQGLLSTVALWLWSCPQDRLQHPRYMLADAQCGCDQATSVSAGVLFEQVWQLYRCLPAQWLPKEGFCRWC